MYLLIYLFIFFTLQTSHNAQRNCFQVSEQWRSCRRIFGKCKIQVRNISESTVCLHYLPYADLANRPAYHTSGFQTCDGINMKYITSHHSFARHEFILISFAIFTAPLSIVFRDRMTKKRLPSLYSVSFMCPEVFLPIQLIQY